MLESSAGGGLQQGATAVWGLRRNVAYGWKGIRKYSHCWIAAHPGLKCSERECSDEAWLLVDCHQVQKVEGATMLQH